MDRNDWKLCAIFIVTIFFLTLNIISGKLLNQYIYIGLGVLIFIIFVLVRGVSKDNSIYKKDILQQIFIYVFLYLLITYILGIFTGFLKSTSIFGWSSLSNILVVFLEIVIVELIRYVVVSKNKVHTIVYIIMVITFVVFETLLSIYKYELNTFLGILKLSGVVILPSISKNVMLIYVSRIGGYKPTILYRIITELSLYILPIFPDFGNYIKAIIDFLFPIALLLRFMNLYSKRKKVVTRTNRRIRNILMIVTAIIMVVIVYLVSCLFKYKAIVVGSGSMSPEIQKGDVVISERLDSFNEYRVGDVLLYYHDKKIVVHRIIEIIDEKEKYIFKTKGDNNEADDPYDIYEEDILGKAALKIKFIGYPSVWLSELVG